jgi:hypothetical protein
MIPAVPPRGVDLSVEHCVSAQRPRQRRPVRGHRAHQRAPFKPVGVVTQPLKQRR